jgi:hypothetical protein
MVILDLLGSDELCHRINDDLCPIENMRLWVGVRDDMIPHDDVTRQYSGWGICSDVVQRTACGCKKNTSF